MERHYILQIFVFCTVSQATRMSVGTESRCSTQHGRSIVVRQLSSMSSLHRVTTKNHKKRSKFSHRIEQIQCHRTKVVYAGTYATFFHIRICRYTCKFTHTQAYANLQKVCYRTKFIKLTKFKKFKPRHVIAAPFHELPTSQHPRIFQLHIQCGKSTPRMSIYYTSPCNKYVYLLRKSIHRATFQNTYLHIIQDPGPEDFPSFFFSHTCFC